MESDVARHVPFHPAMKNDEYDKGAHQHRRFCMADI